MEHWGLRSRAQNCLANRRDIVDWERDSLKALTAFLPRQPVSTATWDPAVQMSQACQETSLSSLSFTVWDLMEPLARGCCSRRDLEVHQGLKLSLGPLNISSVG